MAAVVAAPVLVALGSAPAQAAGSPCDLAGGSAGVTLFRWTGGAADGNWKTPGNWAVDGPDAGTDPDLPARSPHYDVAGSPPYDDSTTAFVCVDPNTPTTIQLGFSRVHVQAIEVGQNVTLNSTNARLMVYGAAPDVVSTLRAGSRLNLHGSYLGGPGQIDLAGHLEWGLLGGSTATLTNDVCEMAFNGVAACATAPQDTGLLRVVDGGTVNVNGRGVNLSDGYEIAVADGGRLTVTGAGYIAADWTTTTTVAGGGTFEFTGDGSIFEGKFDAAHNGTLGVFVNNGTVRKTSGGTGVSSLNVRYSGAGEVDVDAGTLNIANGSAARIDVAEGAIVGTGTCVEATACLPSTTDVDVQSASVELLSGSSGLAVAEEMAVTPAGTIERQVRIEADSAPGDGDLVLNYDRAVVNQVGSQKVEIFRGLSPVPDCAAGGVFPSGQVTACVVGRTIVGRAVRARIRARLDGLEGVWRAQARPYFYRATDPLVGLSRTCAVTAPSYPYTTLRVWRRSTGPITIRYSTQAGATGTAVRSATLPGGVSSVAKVPVRASGFFHVRDTNSGLKSLYYEVVATGALDFTRLTRTVVRGNVVTLRGDVDDPYGGRPFRLFMRKPGAGFLESTSVTGRTTSSGAFTVSYRVPRGAVLGKWRFAIRLSNYGVMRPAMSSKAVRVNVVRPQRVPPADDTRSTDFVTTVDNQPNPVAEGGWTKSAAADPCRYYVR